MIEILLGALLIFLYCMIMLIGFMLVMTLLALLVHGTFMLLFRFIKYIFSVKLK